MEDKSYQSTDTSILSPGEVTISKQNGEDPVTLSAMIVDEEKLKKAGKWELFKKHTPIKANDYPLFD